MDDWVGRGAVVLGANSPPGLKITKKLLDMGMKVVAIDEELEAVQELMTSDPGRQPILYCQKVNLSNEEEIIEAFQMVEDSVGGANVLVNIAGIMAGDSILESQNEELQKLGKVNILAGALGAREFIRSATDRFIPLGHIINISRVYALRVPKRSFYHINAGLMSAIYRFSQHLRQELEFRDSSIKVTNILSKPADESSSESKNVACFDALSPDHFADAVEYVLKTSYNVQVRDIYLEPIEQSD